MLRTFIVLAATLLFVGCGKEQGAKARLHLNTYAAPESVIQQGTAELNKTGTTQAVFQSVSSQSIRNQTLGMRITSNVGANNTVEFIIEHFEGMDQNKCRSTVQPLKVSTSNLTQWTKGTGISLICHDTSCTYLMVIIDRTHSSMLDSNGFIPAFVPIILGTPHPTGGKRTYNTTQARDPFLSLKVNTICITPDALVNHENPVAISPVDNQGPDYNYFPDNDNNTWIY